MSKEEALMLLKKLGLPERTIKHSIAVANKAIEIAKKIQAAGHTINLEVVEIGALLHDIGRIKIQGIHHAAEGGKILRAYGYSEEIARIAIKHSLNDHSPETLEEKIVCYADKIIKGTKVMSIDDRFDIWIKRYGNSQFLVEAKKNILEIEKEIFNLLSH